MPKPVLKTMIFTLLKARAFKKINIYSLSNPLILKLIEWKLKTEAYLKNIFFSIF